MKLYRAASDSFASEGYSFAADIEDAKAYFDNPGFGGENLYECEIEIDEVKVLDLYSLGRGADLVKLIELVGYDPCSTTADVWLTSTPKCSDAVIAAGFEWARVLDTYPEGCETWVYLAGEEPELKKIGCKADFVEVKPAPARSVDEDGCVELIFDFDGTKVEVYCDHDGAEKSVLAVYKESEDRFAFRTNIRRIDGAF